MTLEEAIAQLVADGQTDPTEIATEIQARHDKHWLQSELLASADIFIAHLTRQIIGLRRRRGESTMEEASPDKHDPLTDLIWVPATGYKRKADLTALDCRRVAANYQRLAGLMEAKAELYDRWAAQIDAIGCETVSDLGAAALPEAA